MKDATCPRCGAKMDFIPKDPETPWLMRNGWGCPCCDSYYFDSEFDEEEES